MSSWAAVDLEPLMTGVGRNGEPPKLTKKEFFAQLMARPDPRCPDRSEGCSACSRYRELIKAISRMPRVRAENTSLLTLAFVCPFDSAPHDAEPWDCSFDIHPGGEAQRFWCCCGRSDQEHEVAILRWAPPAPRITCPKYGDRGHDAQACPACIRARAQARTIAAEEDSLALDEWFGVPGDLFDPATPEPQPCVLEVEPGDFVFAPGISFLFGPRGSAKTWLCYLVIVQELKRGNSVLLIDYEMSYEEAMRRLHALGASKEELARVAYVHPSATPSDRDRQRLLERFAAGHPSLVVIDSTGMAMAASGLDENSGSDVAQFSTFLPSWLKAEWPDAVILLVDHVPKNSTNDADPIGSQRKGAIADRLYLVQRHGPISRTVRGSGRVILKKDRNGWAEEGSEVLDFEFGGGGPFVVRRPDANVAAIDGDLTQSAGRELLRVAQYVGSHEGCKVEEARDALSIRPNDFSQIKDVLVGKGVIDHRPRVGLYKGDEWEAYCVSNGE